MAQRLPAVPEPPMDLSAPYGASMFFTVMCVAFFIIAVGYVLYRLGKGDRFGLLFLVGGLVAGSLEPMLDYLGLLWFAADNVAIAVTTFHRHVPLYVVLGYGFYFGGLSYVGYRAMQNGKGLRWFWAFFAFDWTFDLFLQATGRALGLYQYYGNQPFLVLDVPMWWFTIDSTMPVLCAGTVFLMRDHLQGWKALFVIPLVPGMYMGVNGAAGWPVFSALNSATPEWLTWAAGAATIGLALLYRHVMLLAVEHRHARDRAVLTADGIASAGRARVPSTRVEEAPA